MFTSDNNPLQIGEVGGPDGCGRVGMTICPGKHQGKALSGSFQRDLAQDLDLVKSWGAAAVVTLMSDSELSALKVIGLGDAVDARGISWFQLPIEDQQLPDEVFDRLWTYAGVRLRALLRADQKILIHCRSGLSRSGLVAARLLIELGVSADAAAEQVRAARPGTLSEATHIHYLTGCSVPQNDLWMDRTLGCLLGGAVGDAFGYAVEFDSLATIRQRFGQGGITKPVYQAAKLVVSDDTQMSLFTLEGMLRGAAADAESRHDRLLESIRLAYLDWYDTQRGAQSKSGKLKGELASRPSLRVQRAPGQTCLSALQEGGNGSIGRPLNNSKGCGGVMRVAPIGFLQGVDHFDLGARSAALTHGHTEGWAPAGLFARIIANLVRGEEKFSAVRSALRDTDFLTKQMGRTIDAKPYERATKLARKMRFNPTLAIQQLGQGWTGDEALAIALYAFLSARSFTDAICRASNHDGDSDSTASIAGQLWGAAFGLMDIPQEWVRRLDVLDEILLLARGLQRWSSSNPASSIYYAQIEEHKKPCIRMLEMAHELHVLGYQKIHIYPYLAPSGCYWRLECAAASDFHSPTSPPSCENERAIARYTSGSGWAPYEWEGVEALTAQDMAQQFLQQFPDIARAGYGADWEYAGWLTQLLGEVRKGRLPYLAADWPIDLRLGIPMTEGELFPLPPRAVHRELGKSVSVQEVVDAQQSNNVSSIQEPELGDFDFSDPVSRAHGLVAFYHRGESHLLQVTQLIWQQLPEPREQTATSLCLLAGVTGAGKIGLHNLLKHYLKKADEAAATAAGDSDDHWLDDKGNLIWAQVESTFEQMDKALLSTAYPLSLLIEKLTSGQ